jgi:hypothetical protein
MGDSRTPLKLRLVDHLKDDEYYDEQWRNTDVIHGSMPTQNVPATNEMNSVFLALMWSQIHVRVDHFTATKTAKTDLAILGVYRILFNRGLVYLPFLRGRPGRSYDSQRLFHFADRPMLFS